MFDRNVLLFSPQKILYIGLSILIGGILLCVLFLSCCGSSFSELEEAIEILKKPEHSDFQSIKENSLDFSLGLKKTSFGLSLPKIGQEFVFLLDPPRPDETSSESSISLKWKKSGLSKRIHLPCRLDLQFLEKEKLQWMDTPSSFWVELNQPAHKKIQGKVFIETPLSEKIETENFIAVIQEPSFQNSQEFPEGSPFRLLGEGKWLGPDKFREKYENGALYQRIEIGSHSMDFQEGDWMIWSDHRWMKGLLLDGAHKPIAKIKAVQGKSLIFEGWEKDRYVSVALNHHLSPSLKMKGEELFTSIRVRSAKQISCMLEKQWMILKSGDWVLKTDGKWKILKKQQEKDSYKEGKLPGELLVFEKIESKSGQKWIQGLLFSSDRSQMLPFELAASAHRTRKGKIEGDARKMSGSS
jgi:hypothetical protein